MITGTGPFEMPSNSTFQRLSFCLLMFIAGIMNAFLIGGVVSMLERMHERRIEFYGMMDTVNSFIKEKKLNFIKVKMPDASEMDGNEFSERLRRYYIYRQNEGATSASWNDITSTCSPYVRSSVARMMHADQLLNVQIFKNAKSCMITHLCKEIVTVVYSTKDYIVMPNDPLTFLFMIERGTVLHNGFKRLSEGDSFGEELLVKPEGTPSGFSAVCLSDVVVLQLDRDTIFDAIELFADDLFKARLKFLRNMRIIATALKRATTHVVRTLDVLGGVDILAEELGGKDAVMLRNSPLLDCWSQYVVFHVFLATISRLYTRVQHITTIIKQILFQTSKRNQGRTVRKSTG